MMRKQLRAVFTFRLLVTRQSPHHDRCQCHTSTSRVNDHVRVRFAPSPTGELHLGGLRTALFNFLFAKSHGGKFILRIEDTDQTRCVPGAVEKLIGSLEWAKIVPDEGPIVGGVFGPYVQSERLTLYNNMSEKLIKNGTAYRCFCSERRLDLMRREALRQREVPKYDNRCRHLSDLEVKEKLEENVPYTIRLKLEHHNEPWNDLVYGPIVTDVASIEGDPIIMKTDGFPTYHFANVIDDHFMQITHVMRGMEWQVSTTKHLLLYKAFGWDPPQFAHLPLLLNKDGKKLSKREGAIHVEHFKDQGYYPEAILNLLTDVGSGFTIKQTAGMGINELIQNFDLKLMNTNSTRVDFDKLADLNRLHLASRINNECQRKQLVKQLLVKIEEKYKELLLNSPVKPNEEYIENVLECTKNRINHLDDLLTTNHQYLWVAPSSEQVLSRTPTGGSRSNTTELLEALVSALAKAENSSLSDLKTLLKSICGEHSVSLGSGMKVFRAALSGLKEGPSIAEMIQALGPHKTTERLQFALKCLRTSDS